MSTCSHVTSFCILHVRMRRGKLWRHQEEALMRAIYAYELLQERELLLNIVTGGGKTAIIGAVIAWLKFVTALISSFCFALIPLFGIVLKMISLI